MFQFYSLSYTISSNSCMQKTHDEFWANVYKAQEKSRGRTPYNQCYSEWIEARDFLQAKGWADVSYFSSNAKNNLIYKAMIDLTHEEIDKCQRSGQSQFACAMWLMDPNQKEHLFRCANPETHLRLHVLLPPQGKEWLLQEHHHNRIHTYKVFFIGMHFPTVFSATGSWINASEDESRRIKEYFRERICKATEDLRRSVFCGEQSMEQELDRFYIDNWEYMNKLYCGLIVKRADFYTEYQLIVKELSNPPLVFHNV